MRNGIALGCAVPVMALMLAAGCGRKPAEESVEKPPPETVAAVVIAVQTEPLDVLYEAVGTVRSRTTSALASRVVGDVVAVNVRPGDEVQAGQALLQISDRDAAAQLDRAKAALKQAEDAIQEANAAVRAADSAKSAADAHRALATATYQRFQTLFERRSASRQELDEVEAKYKAAVAEADRADNMLQSARARERQAVAGRDQAVAGVATAETYLGYTRIISPIEGLVTKKNVDVGDQAAPGVPLLVVEDNRNYRLEASVEETRARLIRIGDPAAVSVDALGSDMAAKVAEIVPAADPASRSFLVKLDLPAKEGLRSGMFGRATFAVGKRQGIVLPPDAFLERGELTYVHVVDSADIARLRLVKTGKRHDGRVEVLSGLEPGERVAAKGDVVRDGARISAR